MRIAVVSQVPPPVHGSTVMTQELLSALSRLGHSAVLVDRRFSSDVASIGKLSIRKAFSGISLVWRAFRISWRGRPDCVVLFLTNRPASFLSDLLVLSAFRLNRVPVVHYVHTVGFRRLAARGRVWERAVAYVLGSAQAIVCLGPSLADDILPWADAEKLRTIGNLTSATRPVGVERSGVRLAFMSNLIPEKGAREFVAVAVAIADLFPDVTFTLAGAAGDADYFDLLMQDIQVSGLGDRLRYVGQVGGDERWQYLASASALVFPSSYEFEAQPLTIIEALSVGTSVIAYDVGGIRDLGSDDAAAGDAALHLVCGGSIDALAGVIGGLLRQYGEGGWPDRGAERFGAERFDGEWQSALVSIVGGGRAASPDEMGQAL